jgi:Xaa-Pro dipeptidase
MPDERVDRVAATLREIGADFAVLTSVEAVCYATGFAGSIEWGASPFAGGPNTALVTRDGTVGLVVDTLNEPEARQGYATAVRAYEGFSAARQPPLLANYLATVESLAGEMDVAGVGACEPGFQPVALTRRMSEVAKHWVDVTDPLSRTRAVKTAREIDKLRAAARVTATGQHAALEATLPGRTELEAFGRVRTAMEQEVGCRLAITGDYISGVTRTAACEGWPTDRGMEVGDPVIVDLAPRVDGYWGDSCNTIIIGGEPQAELARMFTVTRDALERAADVLRPGIRACDADREVRAVITRGGYQDPLHVGHGIGTGVHEFPRLVAGERASLETDMVLMVEPGAYVPGVGGVRLEWMFRLTRDGNQVLSPFEHVMSLPIA